jgi:peroxiredoxin
VSSMKNIVKWIVVVLLVMALAWLMNMSVNKLEAKKGAKNRLTSLPEAELFLKDSVKIDLSTFQDKPNVLIYFNSECGHCQYEAKDIKNKVEAFSRANVIFMSSESLDKIEVFAQAHGLTDYQNIYFTKINSEHAAATFGTLAVPHVFIYGLDNKLIKEFKGETKAEAILKYLN